MSRPRTCFAVVLTAFLVVSGRPAQARCLLANPSFELPGTPGAVFAGGSQFGPVGSTAIAPHGAVAARVSGPNTGGWDVAGFWQALDTTPGMRWVASVHVTSPSSRPLAGQAKAIVNIEWRDGGGNLISYESHTAADASTPQDQPERFTITSQPAPPGTVKGRLLLRVGDSARHLDYMKQALAVRNRVYPPDHPERLLGEN